MNLCSFVDDSTIFHDESGRKVYVEWHEYLGPSFSYDRDFTDGGFMPDENSILWTQLEVWRQF